MEVNYLYRFAVVQITRMVAQEVTLHEVWCSNMEEEFANMRMLLDDYPYVAMDTEFPGVIATPLGTFRAREGFNYQQLASNVNVLKLIQVGITLLDEKGNLPPGKDVWQFNFQFNLVTDLYSTDSIELLRSSGFDFNRHLNEGILMEDFGELLTTSGLLVDKRITWLTFHSCFDFGYLLRSVLLGDLPMDEAEFLRYHRALFPNCFDIKMFLKQPGPVAAMLRGSLQDVADQLQVARIGQSHQAGSDSLLTAMTFFKLKERFFCDCWDEVAREVRGQIYGLCS